MKVGIITYYNGNNHGALLQAYALCKYLEQIGVDAQVIRFTPQKIKRRTLSVALKQFIIGLRKEKQYDRFLIDFIPHSKKYSRYYNLENLNDFYDAFITGSDQVFNVKAIDKKGYYYLSFASKKAISYAASFGASQIPKEDLALVKPYLDKMDAVSMRELTGVKAVESVTNKKVTWTIDPTFLLSKDKWSEIIENPQMERPYIFAYYNSKEGCNEMIKNLAKKLSMDVVVVSRTEENIKSDYIKDYSCSPNKFLGYIQNAAIVCSDSFHGTALSVILRKPFVTYVSSLDGESEADTRKVELLKRIGLQDRLVTDKTELTEEVLNIDYTGAEKCIAEWVSESEDFLKEQLL